VREETERRSVGGVWTDVSFWTRAPGVRIYKAQTEFREIPKNVRALANGFATAAGGGEQWQAYSETPTLSRRLVHSWFN